MLDLETLAHCCGIAELGNFDDLEKPCPHPCPAAKYAEYGEHHCISDGEADSITNAIKGYRTGAIIATTIPSQKEAITELISNGFVNLMVFRNPGSRNVVTLWGKVICKTRSKKV